MWLEKTTKSFSRYEGPCSRQSNTLIFLRASQQQKVAADESKRISNAIDSTAAAVDRARLAHTRTLLMHRYMRDTQKSDNDGSCRRCSACRMLCVCVCLCVHEHQNWAN